MDTPASWATSRSDTASMPRWPAIVSSASTMCARRSAGSTRFGMPTAYPGSVAFEPAGEPASSSLSVHSRAPALASLARALAWAGWHATK